MRCYQCGNETTILSTRSRCISCETSRGDFNEKEQDNLRIIIENLRYDLSRYSMSAGAADQWRAEARACRDELGIDVDSDEVSPSDLREVIRYAQGK